MVEKAPVFAAKASHGACLHFILIFPIPINGSLQGEILQLARSPSACSGLFFWFGTRLCSILPFSGPIHQERSPATRRGLEWGPESTQGSSGKGLQVVVALSGPSYVPGITGSLPFHFSARHCTKLLSRGSVIRDLSVQKGQAGMLGNKSGHQKNVCL